MTKNKILKLILPINKDFTNGIDEIVCLYPETQRTPEEQVAFMRQWISRYRNNNLITIVSVSPYIFEAAIKMLSDYFTDEQVEYNDGENKISNNEFWKHQATPMQELFLNY